ncbi:hypothetical protein OOK21_34390 [Streptomyces sp. NBC_00338]|nr:hypothetical protein [Streptomyces sp. NBC_00338]
MELNDAGPAVPVGGVSDRELWARAVDGDREAFGRIFDRHGKAVYNHLFRRTADWAEAEDLTSTVFLHAWRRRSETVLDRESALPWLLGIADRLLSNTWRRLRRAEAPCADCPARRAGRRPRGPRRRPGRRRASHVGDPPGAGSAAAPRTRSRRAVHGRAWINRRPRQRWGWRSGP